MVLIVDFPQREGGFPLHRDDDYYINPRPARSRRRRYVSFADKPEVNDVENLAIKHRSDLWLSPLEMSYIKQRTIDDLQKIALCGEGCDGDDRLDPKAITDEIIGTYFGLERYLSPKLCSDILDRRRSMWNAIFFEQDRQYRIGISDPDLLANISEVESDSSRRRANMIGLQHAYCR
jgi:hypothetical protein